jgi:D-alanyl-D-alanine carboxypeptidase (penicillin-binding protein 5/6)
MMNDTAVKLGLSKGAHFINTSGLDRVDLGKYAPASIPGETTFSARDAALIAYHLINEHKEILEFTKIPAKKFRETDKNPMINWDWMLEGNANNVNFKKFVYPGLDGLKTGHTDNAGYCFTGTAEQNGMRLISVVMGIKSSRDNSFLETKKLLDYGFTNFELKQVIPAKSEVAELKEVPVRKGVKTKVPVVTEKAISFMVKKGTTDEAFKREAQANEESRIVAPLKQGDPVGTYTVTYNNVTQKVNLVAKEEMKKGSWIRLFFRAVKNFFADLFSGIKNLF